MNVLSLFDGMSCGQLALRRAQIPYKNYFASEIDKYCKRVTRFNFPETKYVARVENLEVTKTAIDLVIGGSPCQGFSFAGKQLNFNDPRSKLFFEYVRILNECRAINPDVKFLLENVVMRKDYQAIISEHLGVKPIEINSTLVSAQNRRRLYWTNISSNITQPDDRGIFLKDILEIDGDFFGRITGRRLDDSGVRRDYDKSISKTLRVEINKNPIKSNCLTRALKDNVIGVIKDKGQYFDRSLKALNIDAGYAKGMDNRGQRTMILKAGLGGKVEIRKLTPIECERLQTVPDNYTLADGISNTQRYNMLGNGWNVDTIVHVFRSLKEKNQ